MSELEASDTSVSEENDKVDFKHLSPDEILELNEFQDYLRTEATPLDEVETFIENHQGSIRVLGIKDSKNRHYLEKKYSNKVISYEHSYFIFDSDPDFKQHYQDEFLGKGKRLSQHERHAEYLIWKKEPILFCFPPDFFTHFSQKPNMWQMVTIREFEYLVNRISELEDAPSFMIVEDEVEKGKPAFEKSTKLKAEEAEQG